MKHRVQLENNHVMNTNPANMKVAPCTRRLGAGRSGAFERRRYKTIFIQNLDERIWGKWVGPLFNEVILIEVSKGGARASNLD
jgi:hypothetical protein